MQVPYLTPGVTLPAAQSVTVSVTLTVTLTVALPVTV
jgi:hypothetical protein